MEVSNTCNAENTIAEVPVVEDQEVVPQSFKSRLSSFPVEICYSPSKGRFIKSNRNIASGEVVFRGLPYAFAILDAYKKRVCDWCLAFDDQGRSFNLHCTQCQQVWWCSTTCKEEARQHHEHLCAAFKKTASSKKSQGKHSLSLLKILFKILDRQASEQSKCHQRLFYQLGAESQPQDYETSYSDVTHLISNRSTWTVEETKDWKKTAVLACQVFANQEDLTVNQASIFELISRIESNNFGLWTKKNRQCFGRALYPLASLFNHSCEPNCEAEINGVYLSICAKEDIPAGTELCIRYIDTDVPRSTRREKLQSEYRFLCDCTRCEREKDKSDKISYHNKKAPATKVSTTGTRKEDDLQSRIEHFKKFNQMYSNST